MSNEARDGQLCFRRKRVINVLEALGYASSRLEEAGLEHPEREASALLEELLGVSRSELLLSRTRILSADELARLGAWLERRAAREPLQHVVGVAHFYDLTLAVGPNVLVPRPETERLVELGLGAIKHISQPNILDVGTGSGAVALALKAERPDAAVWATDLSEKALSVASGNAERLGLKVTFVQADLLADPTVQSFAGRADLLVANLPYLPEGDAAWLSPEVQRDPASAIFSGRDGLGHTRRLLEQAATLLKPRATCLLELDPRNVRQAETEVSGWVKKEVLTDLVGRERFLKLKR